MNTYIGTPTIELLITGLTKLGYVCESFKIDTVSFTRFQSPTGKVWLTQSNRIAYPFTSTTARPISTNKHLAYALADRIGVQIPFTKVLDSAVDNKAVYSELLDHAPLIVKPNASSLSRGLTMNITSGSQLEKAIVYASTYSKLVLVQKQVQGEEVRFIVLGNEVKAALLRRTARVIGDGKSTLRELLAIENKLRSDLQLNYPQLTAELVDLASLNLEAVPAAGAIIELNRGTMIYQGASMFNVLNDVHPSYIAVAKRLAHEIGAGFIAVDIFIKDYTQALRDADYAFIEFNMSPVLRMLYLCRDGAHYDILKDLIPMIDHHINAGTV